jgi:transposase
LAVGCSLLVLATATSADYIIYLSLLVLLLADYALHVAAVVASAHADTAATERKAGDEIGGVRAPLLTPRLGRIWRAKRIAAFLRRDFANYAGARAFANQSTPVGPQPNPNPQRPRSLPTAP